MDIYEKIKQKHNKKASEGTNDDLGLAPDRPMEKKSAPPAASPGPGPGLKFPNEPSCWGGRCQHAVFVLDPFLNYRPLVCSAAAGDEIIGLQACPLGRWKMVPPGANEAVGMVVRW